MTGSSMMLHDVYAMLRLEQWEVIGGQIHSYRLAHVWG